LSRTKDWSVDEAALASQKLSERKTSNAQWRPIPPLKPLSIENTRRFKLLGMMEKKDSE
jgi:hypothetical protein